MRGGEACSCTWRLGVDAGAQSGQLISRTTYRIATSLTLDLHSVASWDLSALFLHPPFCLLSHELLQPPALPGRLS